MSALEIFDCEQNSAEWYRVRMGMPTASEFSTVLAVGRGGGESKTRRAYLYKLADERIYGEPTENYTNKDMERGKTMEPEARDYYALLTDYELKRVGFIKNAKKGCSPDSLIGKDGILEIKTTKPHLLMELHDSDVLPPEHYAQLQGNLWVAEREWIDLIVYWPNRRPFMKRVFRDETYLTMLAGAIDKFNDELDALVARIEAQR